MPRRAGRRTRVVRTPAAPRPCRPMPRAGRSGRGTSRPADRLQREIFLFHRHVVLELVEGQPRPAAAPEIGHLELAGGPDALNVLDVAVVQSPHRLVLDEVLDPRERVVVLADPDD